MGVLGLTPFIQKHCPEVIKELPHRLRSLSGKTIAIDGTLITQRLHFAPMPCANRHVLGWYRLVRELKEAGVGVICVFDGEERSQAKQRERERRRKLRRADVARGAMEVERLRRLRSLTSLLRQHRALPGPARDNSTKILQEFISNSHEQRDARAYVRHSIRGLDSDISRLDSKTFDFDSMPSLYHWRNSVQASTPEINNVEPQAARDPDVQAEIASDLEYTGHDKETDMWIQDSPVQDYADPEESPATAFSPEYKYPVDKISTGDVTFCSPALKDVPFRDTESPSTTQPSQVILQEPPEVPKSRVQLTDALLPCSEHIGDVSRNVRRTPKGSKDSHDSNVESFIAPDDADRPPADPRKNEAARPELELSRSRAGYPDTGDSTELDPIGSYPVTEPSEPAPSENVLFPDLDVSPLITQVADAASASDDISQSLVSLYKDYQGSVPAFMSPIIDPPTEASSSEDTAEGAREQHVMSRHQVQLTLDEGNLWDVLVHSSITDDSIAEHKLESLALRSDVISKSYEKRNNPPTLQTYDESKLILQAMGVPCIETAVPYEAEALAASLVHHGFADYVASEDTDVLVYEAPLLRNITNRQGPLTLLSGAEVRQVLQLDRASYVDFALLLGTDFSQRIKKIGPHRAIKLIRAHGRIESVIANEPKIIPRLPQDAYLAQVAVARLVFETLPPVPDSKLLQPTETDEEAVAALLDKFGVHREAMVDWDFASALDGNYFDDNPTMT